jgi:nitrite reductase/ring-hydroxylating ferredoxin subunit
MQATPGSSKKPLWTEEFSIYAADDRYVLRRQFTKFLTLTSFGMLVGNAWIWAKSLLDRGHSAALPVMAVAKSADVPAGGVKLFRYPTPQDACILVRKQDGQLVAYSQKCTHLSCAVYYSKDKNRLECPCHEGYFSIETGRVLQGPPPRPLPRVTITERNGQVFATGIDTHSEGV